MQNHGDGNGRAQDKGRERERERAGGFVQKNKGDIFEKIEDEVAGKVVQWMVPWRKEYIIHLRIN